MKQLTAWSRYPACPTSSPSHLYIYPCNCFFLLSSVWWRDINCVTFVPCHREAVKHGSSPCLCVASSVVSWSQSSLVCLRSQTAGEEAGPTRLCGETETIFRVRSFVADLTWRCSGSSVWCNLTTVMLTAVVIRPCLRRRPTYHPTPSSSPST